MNAEKLQINSENYSIYFGSLLEVDFELFLISNYSTSKKMILVDENTSEACLQNLIANFVELKDAEVVVLPAGEENKCLEICEQVWATLLEYNFGRKDAIINLGGGVITDMGGFIASLYKRGIDFIQIPTSLLAMVDASVGGKTGVDFNHYKNVIGVFSNPKGVYIDTSFLETLPSEDLIGGWMEMIKHGLIADAKHFEEIKRIDFEEVQLTHQMIFDSVSIKAAIVQEDPFEEGKRKLLNFGHTFGHGLESYLLEIEEPINHGIAVGVGMLIESYWSFQNQTLSEEELDEIHALISNTIDYSFLQKIPATALWEYMKNDKKNQHNKVLSVLLNGIGNATYNHEVTFEQLEEALEFILAQG